MNRFLVFIVALFLVASTMFDAQAQSFSARKKYWSLGGSLNAMNFVGDVTGSKSPASIDFSLTRPNLSFCAVRRMAPRVSVRGNLFYGRLRGNDRKSSSSSQDADFGRYHRGISFKNDIVELSATGIVDFFENRGTFIKRPDYTPYGFAGLAVLYHNPKVAKSAGKSAKDWTDVNYASFSNVTAALVYGLGFRYKLDNQIDIALEIGWRKAFTDWLDGVSGVRESKLDNPGAIEADKTMLYDDYSDDAVSSIVVYEDNNGDGVVDRYVGKLSDLGDTYANSPTHYTAQSLPGEQFGDDKKRNRNDGYIVTGVHVTYILSGGVKCPKFR